MCHPVRGADKRAQKQIEEKEENRGKEMGEKREKGHYFSYFFLSIMKASFNVNLKT